MNSVKVPCNREISVRLGKSLIGSVYVGKSRNMSEYDGKGK